MHEIAMRYGCNPHQGQARAHVREGEMPLRVLNGAPSYINLLDALNAWQLVKELKEAAGLPAAASFKHVSPAGAAVALALSGELRQACFVGDTELSPLAMAYARARGGDRLSSFGDFIGLSDAVDESTARLIAPEVSDGIIAPGYEPDALEILKEKKGGRYLLFEIDSDYEAPEVESREVFGIQLEQQRNNGKIDAGLLRNVVTDEENLPDEAVRDLLVATVAVKYTQSNSVGLAYDGQVIGMGAGQQSRVHCTRLACAKGDKWLLQQHPRVLSFEFRKGLKRPDKINAIDQYLLWDELSDAEKSVTAQAFENMPDPLTPEERREWLSRFEGLSLSSDGFIPFRDNIDRASRSGVKYVVQPGGSEADDSVTEAANSYGMVMAFSGIRLFHH